MTLGDVNIALTNLLLNNRYELIQPLGQSGMARVYLARDRFLARKVAVKILHPSLSAEKRFLDRFRREAEAAAALNHPHIVGIYDVGQDGDLHYIIMEYVEGLDLKELLLQNGPIPPRRVVDIGGQVASALQYAHERGIVHRDIKPHNILVTPAGLVKVSDFGIAQLLSEISLTDGHSALSTAQYFAPEQAENRPVSPATDVYSLGVVLYEALTGFLPFPDDDPVAVALAHVRQQPVPPSTLHTDVPPEMDSIILKAMAKTPRDRYESAEQLGTALQAWEARTFTLADEHTGEAMRRSSRPAPRKAPRIGCLTRMIGLAVLAAIFSQLALFAVSQLNGNSRQGAALKPTPIIIVVTPRPSTTPAPHP